MDDNQTIEKVDVRVIVSESNMAEIVSKAINNVQLEKDYNIIVSSIIPTKDMELAKKVASGADIILIGSYGQDEYYNILYNDLKTDFNHIGLFNYENVISDEGTIEISHAEREIFNSIIKAGLSYSLNIINIHSLENKLSSLTRKYNSLLDDYNGLIDDNENLEKVNLELKDEITNLNHNIDKIKSDFSSFKGRFEDIHKKHILEIYDLNDLWQEVFDESLLNQEKIIIATNKFRPDNIIVGQGFIGAVDKLTAIDWLKVVKTALIFVEDKENELKKELNNLHNESDDKIIDEREYDIPNNIGDFFG